MVSPPDSGSKGTVIGIDHLSGLTDLSVRNLRSDGVEVGPGKGIEIVTGDGRKGKPLEFFMTLWLMHGLFPKAGSPEVCVSHRCQAVSPADGHSWRSAV